MKNPKNSEKEVIFIQIPPQERGYDVPEERDFYKKYWSIYCRNLNTNRVNYPIWEMPIWIPVLGGILEKEGVSSRFLDISYFCGKQPYYDGEEFTHDKVYSFLSKSIRNPAIFLISPLTLSYNLAIEVAKIIKEINAGNIVIFGGAHASFLDIECLKSPYVDFIVREDGEWTVPELIKNLIENKEVSGIRGITYKTEERIVRVPIRALSRIPRVDYFPKYEFFPKNFGKKVPYLRTCLNRGCPYHCAFCGDIWNNMKPQEYPIWWTIKEIEFLKRRFGNCLFYLNDETFLCKTQKYRILQFAEEIRFLNVRWIVQTRINQLDKEALTAMHLAGCRQVELGCETVIQRSLDLISKGTKVLQIEKALEKVKETGISTYGYWIIGLPSESKEDVIKIQDSIVELIKRGLLDILNYSILVPYPGTKIFRNPKKFGMEILTDDYSKYHEYGIPVYRTEKLSPQKIFDLWKRGMNEFSEVL